MGQNGALASLLHKNTCRVPSERAAYTWSLVKSLPKVVTTLGLICVVIGVGWGFVDVATHFEYSFLSRNAELFILTLLIGIVLSFVGTIWWARRLARRRRLGLAGALLLGSLAIFAVPVNVHGPTMFLVPVVFAVWILALILALMR